MSHLPIREAIRQLESRGLVEHIPHRGGRVTEISLEDLRELYDARLVIEPEIISRAAENFSNEDAEAARAALARHAEALQMTEIWAAHTAFHFALYNPCRSRWLLRLVTPLWESSQRYRMTMPPLNSEMRRKEAQREHEEMLAACEAHDGARAAAVRAQPPRQDSEPHHRSDGRRSGLRPALTGTPARLTTSDEGSSMSGRFEGRVALVTGRGNRLRHCNRGGARRGRRSRRRSLPELGRRCRGDS